MWAILGMIPLVLVFISPFFDLAQRKKESKKYSFFSYTSPSLFLSDLGLLSAYETTLTRCVSSFWVFLLFFSWFMVWRGFSRKMGKGEKKKYEECEVICNERSLDRSDHVSCKRKNKWRRNFSLFGFISRRLRERNHPYCAERNLGSSSCLIIVNTIIIITLELLGIS